MSGATLPRWTRWLRELREGDVATRVRAARWLAEEPPLPAESVGTLIEALFDDAWEHEDWTDWNGAVVGGSDHHVWWYALEALGKMGAPGIKGVVEAVRRRPAFFAPHLARLASEAPPDTLAALGPAGRSALRTALEEGEPEASWLPQRAAGLAHLAWVEAEAASGKDRESILVGRLAHPLAEAQRRAVAELGRAESPAARRTAATALADALLAPEPLAYPAQVEAGPALVRLGAVLDPTRVEALVTACLEGRLFHVWSTLFDALAAYGPGAARLRPMLEAWASEGRPPRQIGVDYHKEVRAAARRALGRMQAGP